MSLPTPSVLLATRASVAVTTFFASLLASGSKDIGVVVAGQHYTKSFGSLAAMVDPSGADAGAMANKHKRTLAPLTEKLIKAAAQFQKLTTFLLSDGDGVPVGEKAAFEKERRAFYRAFDQREHRVNIGYFTGAVGVSLENLVDATDAFVAALGSALGGGPQVQTAVQSAFLSIESLIVQNAIDTSPDIARADLLFDGAAHLAFQVARLRPTDRGTNELLARSERYLKIYNEALYSLTS